MAISVAQSGQAGAGGGNWAVTLGSPTTSGNTLFYVATAYQTSGAAPASSAPTLGGSPVSGAANLAETQDSAFIRLYVAIWMLPDVPGGQTACSITMANSQTINNVGLGVYEVSGLGASPALDQSSLGNSASAPSTAVDSGTTGTTAHAAEFVLGGASIDQNTGAGAAGFTSMSFGGNTNSWSGYQIVSSTGTFDWAQTAGSAANWAAVIVTVATPPPPSPGPAYTAFMASM